MAGEYNVKYTFDTDNKIKSIEFEVIDDSDIIVVNSEGYHTVQMEEDSGNDIYYTDWYEYTVTEQYANIGVGWEFDFPYIERLYSNTTGGQGNQDYLHFGAKGVWRIDDDYKLDGYYLNDIEVSAGGEFEGEDCYMTATEKDGKKYYFGDLGELLGIEDRYGNQIT